MNAKKTISTLLLAVVINSASLPAISRARPDGDEQQAITEFDEIVSSGSIAVNGELEQNADSGNAAQAAKSPNSTVREGASGNTCGTVLSILIEYVRSMYFQVRDYISRSGLAAWFTSHSPSQASVHAD